MILCVNFPETDLMKRQNVLSIYDTIRPPRATYVQRESVRMGRLYHGFGPKEGGNDITTTQNQLRGIWEPVWNHDLEGEVSQHLDKFYGPKAKL
jgi:salicylate hydroxylase